MLEFFLTRRKISRKYRGNAIELQLADLSKKYGPKAALDSFSHTFRDGICGILGATGAVERHTGSSARDI